ncbi:MAG: ATP-binding protein [Planctomycetota bacterium]
MRRPPQLTGRPRELTLVVPATHAAARIVRKTVTDFARLDGLPSSEVDHMALVVSELLGNAVDHGGGGSAMEIEDLAQDVTMQLGLELAAEQWVVWVDDQGGGDPTELAGFLAPGAEIPLEDERGRGFFLMREMVDDLTIAGSADGLGIRVRAVKRHGSS